MKKKWYSEGIRFECQGSGKCCSSRGEYGFVYLTKADVLAAAKALRVRPEEFISEHCQYDEGNLCLKDNPSSADCLFLDGNRCEIYEGRPTQCRTWPFWPEVMNAKSWSKNVQSFCPGVDKGRLYSQAEIEEVLKEQKQSDRSAFRKGMKL